MPAPRGEETVEEPRVIYEVTVTCDPAVDADLRGWLPEHVGAMLELPGFTGAHGLPVGIQLVAGRYRDARLLATAARVEEVLAARQHRRRLSGERGQDREAVR